MKRKFMRFWGDIVKDNKRTYNPCDIFLILRHLLRDTRNRYFVQGVLLECIPVNQWLCEKFSRYKKTQFFFESLTLSSNTYLGSQWAIVKSKLILVTNISHSSRISWIEGGGKATARPTIPSNCAWDFFDCVKLYWVLKRQRINTTCVMRSEMKQRKTTKFY